jgi:hypothetical protein
VNIVIVRYLGRPLSPIDTLELLHTLDQIDRVDIYRVFLPTPGNTHSFLQLMELFLKYIVF